MGARKGKWEQVKEHIDNGDIREWCKTMTERQMAEMCGVAMSSWSDYKLKYPILTEEIKFGRALLCEDLKSALIKKALGGKYEKVKTNIKKEGGKKR